MYCSKESKTLLLGWVEGKWIWDFCFEHLENRKIGENGLQASRGAGSWG